MAATRLHALRVNARELLRQPGLEKRIELSIPATDLGVEDERITGDVSVDLTATSTVDGVTVRGTVSLPWRTACRRCLVDVTGVATAEVDETYHDQPDPRGDGFELVGDQIDLAGAVREYVVLELPHDQLCREACAGICPLCGADLNDGPCDCDTSVRDERWAALDALRLDDGPADADAADG